MTTGNAQTETNTAKHSRYFNDLQNLRRVVKSESFFILHSGCLLMTSLSLRSLMTPDLRKDIWCHVSL